MFRAILFIGLLFCVVINCSVAGVSLIHHDCIEWVLDRGHCKKDLKFDSTKLGIGPRLYFVNLNRIDLVSGSECL